FTFMNCHCDKFAGSFIRLSDFRGAENQGPKTLEAIRNPDCGWRYTAKADDFKKIPGSPIAYWVSARVREIFSTSTQLDAVSEIKQGLATCNNNLFLRLWFEVSSKNVGYGMTSSEQAFEEGYKWFPYNKGGGYRKWYGNNEYLVNWWRSGEEIHRYSNLPMDYSGAPVRAKRFYFREGITYCLISSFGFSARRVFGGFIFDVGGSMIFPELSTNKLQGFLGSKIVKTFISILNPTLNYQVGDIQRLPINKHIFNRIEFDWSNIIAISKVDWDSYETSWDFNSFPLIQPDHHQPTLTTTYTALRAHWREMTLEMQRLEEENNRIFIEAYGLQDELTPDVLLSEITLTCNPHYRYGGKKSDNDLETLLLTNTIKELISYAIGCMMGRYSLDEPGLIYAHSSNENFWEIYNHKTNKHSDNPSLRSSRLCGEFQPDDDGIIPIMDMVWFDDDATNRFIEFIKVAWSPETLDENLKFIADNLKPKNNEVPIDTIRRYLSAGFFKDHLKTYKKRPIYWLFSSGKQKAFECLVYLHRYNESTLSRMRSAYITPLQGNFNARIEFLEQEKDAATTASVQRKIQKEIDILKKKRGELSAFDIELRHYADMKISLDLDDGVKVNYDKFGNLLAEKKTVTGKK
ncbi:MAG: BREX-1 system adenine-specific DNA-methyltransferase PglX, partial [Deltaproteobacteria bacterium]|nr:BREX-1 system adenine-specific DNA-methyltransferase PglX [Deltaproteobacteria bacterium]